MTRRILNKHDEATRMEPFDRTAKFSGAGPRQSTNDTVELPSISLPRGGGAIKGIEEKFQVNAVTGTLSLTVPIPLSPSRHGFVPAVGLKYDSGNGNSAFGIGWELTVPRITRKTDKLLPQYHDDDESDTFVLSGSEDLVPLLERDDGAWKRDIRTRNENGSLFAVRRYRPRIEGSFLVIERWTNTVTGETHWRSITPNNVHSYYGTTPESRLADPGDPSKVFEWRLTRTHDDKGNICIYEYKSENFDGVENKLSEGNRHNKSTQTYIKTIHYGNRQAYYLDDDLPTQNDFLFKVVFDYGEHDASASVPKNIDIENDPWSCRKDPFSSYRSGFEIRTYRRCDRILLFHCFDQPDLPHNPYLVSSLELSYGEELELAGSGNSLGGFSYLIKARQNGHKWNPDKNSYSTKSLPESEFAYQRHEWNTAIETLTGDSAAHAPVGVNKRSYLWIDLFNEGISGILTESSGEWLYKFNLGNGTFSKALEVSPKPKLEGLTAGNASILELDGNGVKYLAQFLTQPRGFFKLTNAENWEPFRTFEDCPNFNIFRRDARLLDLTGDGTADLLLTDDDSLTWYRGRGEKGFELSESVSKEIDEEKGPAIVFSDPTQSVFLADMNGDGLTDIARIRNGEVHYWPNLGFGRFGAKVAMDNAPVFDHPDRFDPRNLRLADIDGSGTTDIVYLGKNDFRAWMNLNGNGWSVRPEVISPFPEINDLSDVDVLDFLGTGTASIVYSSSLPQKQPYPMQYIDLMGSKKPHLLVSYQNNCGKEVSLEFKPSTHFYLEDKAQGRKWITKLPFPVHCVSRIRCEDKVRETVYTNSYRYSHGYFDHDEREYRGFARVEQLDTEEFSRFKFNNARNVVEETLHQPPVRTVSWFNTGAFFGKDLILHQCKSEYFQNTEFSELELPLPAVASTLGNQELKEAARALKGLPLRIEVYAEDDSQDKQNPYVASQSTVEIRLIQPLGNNQHASFLVIPSESISYGYERNPADPRISHSFVLETDELGNVRKSVSVTYPRLDRVVGSGAIPDKVWDEQSKLHLVYSEASFTKDVIDDLNGIYRLRVCCESKSYEISGLVQPAKFFFKKGDLTSNINAASEIRFEQDFSGVAEKRLSAHRRLYFLNDELTAPLALGELSALGIVHKNYRLAFTKDLVTKYYGSKVSPQMLSDAKYVHTEGDEHWWRQTGSAIYSVNPRENFYSLVGARDVFGNESYVEYDDLTLLTKSSTDAIGNKSTVENDYRILSPVLLVDPNLNRTAIQTDELGMVLRSAVMGKEGANEGDSLPDPTVRLEYDLFNWKNNRKPNRIHIYAREKHGAENPRWQESYVYSDGGGGVIMTKAQANPGKALRWNKAAGRLDEIDTDTRWIANGRTVLNNKGNPIKQYEPFFSATEEFESEDALLEIGFTPLLFYDPVSRNIRTEFPNGTFSKVEFDAWLFRSYDVNDTVKDSAWYIERGAPDPDLIAEPNDPEQRAAWLAAKHYNTPETVHTDSLGKPFYSITDIGSGRTTNVYTDTDLAERFSFVYDQKGRLIAESYINLLGEAIYGRTAEKGEQWVFNDVMGRPVRIWDNDLREFRSTYDKLHRPVGSYVKEGSREYLFNFIVYADTVLDAAAAQTLNLKGRPLRVYDQAGSITLKKVDFKGNSLEIERRLAKDYRARINDWKTLENAQELADFDVVSDSLLEAEAFLSAGELDALNRTTKVTLADGTIFQPVYNEANFLDSLQAQLRGQGPFETFLEKQDYDAKGQRQYAKYGSGIVTNYTYDPRTHRLSNVLSKLSTGDPNSQAIQNITYTFDPAGNITQIRDDAQQTHYFANSVIYPENRFEYDAVYQLIKSTGREHAGLGGNAQPNNLDLPFLAQLPHLNDLNAVRNYVERYEYDDCGNIRRLQHIANGANWTKRYRYEYEDDPANKTNRLKACSSDGDPDGVFSMRYFHDLHGNITSMPHLPTPDSLVWNYIDQLKEVDLGGGGKAFYVYESGGSRIRKVIERPGGQVKERIYLGPLEIYRERQGDQDPLLERDTVHISDNTGRIAQIDIKTIDSNDSDPDNPINVGLIRYQHGNHLGSATIETDERGNIISYEEYRPFGSSSFRASTSDVDLSLKRYRFCGKERDEETGFYYFGARYYAAWLGRWISSDPAGFTDGQNLYRYCLNNPILFIDPGGTDSKYSTIWHYNPKSYTKEERAIVESPQSDPGRVLDILTAHGYTGGGPLEWKSDYGKHGGWVRIKEGEDVTGTGEGEGSGKKGGKGGAKGGGKKGAGGGGEEAKKGGSPEGKEGGSPEGKIGGDPKGSLKGDIGGDKSGSAEGTGTSGSTAGDIKGAQGGTPGGSPDGTAGGSKEGVPGGKPGGTGTNERSFWSRGGSTLLLGLGILALGLLTVATGGGALVMFAAGMAIGAGAATAIGSGVLLAASYSGHTTAEEDRKWTGALSDAALVASSPGSAIGGGIGAIVSGREGMRKGAFIGGLTEGVISLGVAGVRAVSMKAGPGIANLGREVTLDEWRMMSAEQRMMYEYGQTTVRSSVWAKMGELGIQGDPIAKGEFLFAQFGGRLGIMFKASNPFLLLRTWGTGGTPMSAFLAPWLTHGTAMTGTSVIGYGTARLENQ